MNFNLVKQKLIKAPHFFKKLVIKGETGVMEPVEISSQGMTKALVFEAVQNYESN